MWAALVTCCGPLAILAAGLIIRELVGLLRRPGGYDGPGLVDAVQLRMRPSQDRTPV
jgi:hypothetical protein